MPLVPVFGTLVVARDPAAPARCARLTWTRGRQRAPRRSNPPDYEKSRSRALFVYGS